MKIKYVCAAIMVLMMMAFATGCEVSAETDRKVEKADRRPVQEKVVDTPSPSQSPANGSTVNQTPASPSTEPANTTTNTSNNYYVTNNNSYSTDYNTSYVENYDITYEESTEYYDSFDEEYYDEYYDYDDDEVYWDDEEYDCEYVEDIDWISEYSDCVDISTNGIVDYEDMTFSCDYAYADNGDMNAYFSVFNATADSITRIGMTVYDPCGNIVGYVATDANLFEQREYNLLYSLEQELSIDLSCYDTLYFKASVEAGGTVYSSDYCECVL